ncbi:MAG: hypothetical protein N5P05_003014 [Chroococcopsis gigantea SAG 12.99]|jgi:RNA-directed DNA polymerase|nr:hypothetical protein [Chroococcopsis gigantea SAG 12.99]
MMESRMTRNCHVRFGERDEETHILKDIKVRFVPTPFSPLLANIALNGIESIYQYKKLNGAKVYLEPTIRYADDMVIICVQDKKSV